MVGYQLRSEEEMYSEYCRVKKLLMLFPEQIPHYEETVVTLEWALQIKTSFMEEKKKAFTYGY